MKKVLIACVVSALAGPAAGAPVSFDLTFAFEREFFQDVFDLETDQEIDFVFDGAPYGFSGTFSDLAPGDTVSASVSLESEPGDIYTVTACDFAGIDCAGEFVQVSDDQARIFLSGTDPLSLSFDLQAGTALYYEDGPGGRTPEGIFSFYGAEFSLVDENGADEALSVVPLPASAGLLFGAGFLLWGVRRTSSKQA